MKQTEQYNNTLCMCMYNDDSRRRIGCVQLYGRDDDTNSRPSEETRINGINIVIAKTEYLFKWISST